MFQEFFTRSLLLDWPLFGLVFFVLGFLLAALPLEGDGTATTERNAG